MHDVIKNILARKGRQAPYSDGRKIALVVYGGTMATVRASGALVALEEIGLTNAFDSIYTVSAGFPCGSYFLANQAALGTAVFYQDLINSKFLNFFRLWKMADTEYAINITRTKKVIDLKTLLSNKTKLHVGLFDPLLDQIEYPEVHDYNPEEYFDLLKASVSVPYLCPGDARLRGRLYEDMPFKRNYHFNHLNTAINSGATDILVLYNYFDQKKFTQKLPPYVFEIRPDRDWNLSRFETKQEPLKQAAYQMGKRVKELFGQSGGIQLL